MRCRFGLDCDIVLGVASSDFVVLPLPDNRHSASVATSKDRCLGRQLSVTPRFYFSLDSHFFLSYIISHFLQIATLFCGLVENTYIYFEFTTNIFLNTICF